MPIINRKFLTECTQTHFPFLPPPTAADRTEKSFLLIRKMLFFFLLFNFCHFSTTWFNFDFEWMFLNGKFINNFFIHVGMATRRFRRNIAGNDYTIGIWRYQDCVGVTRLYMKRIKFFQVSWTRKNRNNSFFMLGIEPATFSFLQNNLAQVSWQLDLKWFAFFYSFNEKHTTTDRPRATIIVYAVMAWASF